MLDAVRHGWVPICILSLATWTGLGNCLTFLSLVVTEQDRS